MIRLFVHHRVADFSDWKQAYDAFDNDRVAMGVVGHSVYRSPEDPNDVTVTHDFASSDAARAFVASDRLREAMTAAGVLGEPTMWTGTPA